MFYSIIFSNNIVKERENKRIKNILYKKYNEYDKYNNKYNNLLLYIIMETKEELINTIKKWVKIDNEIKMLQQELNKRRLEKKKLSNDLLDVMRKNDIEVFDIKNGHLMYSKKNIRKPITQKTLLNILSKYYNDELKANEINDFIFENREQIVKENVIIKYYT
jgi:hypothetical protein